MTYSCFPIISVSFCFATPGLDPISLTEVFTYAFGDHFWSTPLEQFELRGAAALESISGIGDFGSVLPVLLSLLQLPLLSLLVAGLFQRPTLLRGSWLQGGAELVVTETGAFLEANAGRALLPMLPVLLLLLVSLGSYNLAGLFPYGFTASAHMLCTALFSFGVFFGLNLVSLLRYRAVYFNLFLPSGTPFGLLPLIVLLEVVSYLSRPFSLAIRLFANMMAGHALLKILLGFIFRGLRSGSLPLLLSLLALSVIFLILIMEFMVALLQVFVFLTLVSLYLVDAHNPSAH